MTIIEKAEAAWNKHATENSDKIQLIMSLTPALDRDVMGHVLRQGWMLQWIRQNSDKEIQPRAIMNEIYIVLQLEGTEPVVCDLWSTLLEAQDEFTQIAKELKVRQLWDSEGLKHELTGTIAIAGHARQSVQIIKRTVHYPL